jgi:hypothetical protein
MESQKPGRGVMTGAGSDAGAGQEERAASQLRPLFLVPRVCLVLRGRLPEAIVHLLHLVHHAAPGSSSVARVQVRVAGSVVRRLDAAHRGVDTGAERRHGIGRWPPEDIAHVGVHVAVAVGLRLPLAQRIDGVGLLLAAAGSPAARVLPVRLHESFWRVC